MKSPVCILVGRNKKYYSKNSSDHFTLLNARLASLASLSQCTHNERKLAATKDHHAQETQPEAYLFWVSAASATLQVTKGLDIVLGHESRPETPANPTPAQRRDLADRDQRHAPARVALLNALEESELIKVYELDNANAIWNRLADEFGLISDLQYPRAEANFRAFQKAPNTSLKDHINKFSKLREARDFYAPAGTPPLSRAQVNLAFLTSLGDQWKLFHQALGNAAYTMKTGELFARVQAMDESTPKNSSPNTQAQALSSRIKGHGGHKQKGKHRFKPYNKSKKTKSSDDASKPAKNEKDTCNYCKQPGHFIKDCLKRKWADSQWSKGNKGNNPASAKKPRTPEVQLDPSHNYYANVTQYTPSVNHTFVPPQNSKEWVVDSASNANITPFKSRLHNFQPFATQGTVKGLGGKRVSALGSGSVTLVDKEGNTHLLSDVLYVPESSANILSLVKMKEIRFRFLEGDFLLTSQHTAFELLGNAVDDILYVTEGNDLPASYTVSTRNASKRTLDPSSSNLNGPDPSEPIKRPRPQEDLSATPFLRTPAPCNPPELWHLCLNHASGTTLSKLSIIKSTFDTGDCISCIRAKQHKTPYSDSQIVRHEEVNWFIPNLLVLLRPRWATRNIFSPSSTITPLLLGACASRQSSSTVCKAFTT